MAATDDFADWDVAPSAPAKNYLPVTPNDDTDLTHVSRGVIIGVAGALKVDMLGNGTQTIPSGQLAVGVIHPLQVTRIYATGTGASNIGIVW